MGGDSTTSFAASAGAIANSLSVLSWWNVQNMRASAGLHKQSRDAAAAWLPRPGFFALLSFHTGYYGIGRKSVLKRCIYQRKCRLYGLTRTAAISLYYPAQYGFLLRFGACICALRFACGLWWCTVNPDARYFISYSLWLCVV